MIKQRKILIDQDEKPERELTVYQYDGSSGILLGQRQVTGQRTTINEWIYTLKACETIEPPPIVEDGRVAVFSRVYGWQTLQDHRGETWFDWKGRPQLVGRPGDPRVWGLRRFPQGEAP